MDEFEKAKTFICDKNHSLTKLSKISGIPLRTLKGYRAEPEKLKVAAWERVHLLAQFGENHNHEKRSR